MLLALSASAQTENQEKAGLYNAIEEGKWHEVGLYFEEEAQRTSFLSHFKQGDTKSFNPYKLVSQANGVAIFVNQAKKEELHVRVSIDTLNGWQRVTRFEVNKVGNNNLRQEAINSIPFNYVALSSQTYEEPRYQNSYLEEFNKNTSDPNEEKQEITYRQINFSPLKLEFEWCEKVLFMNVCGTKTYTKEFGLVLSDKDDPTNDDGYVYKNFSNIKDITAFKTGLDVAGFNPSQGGQFNYTLTAAIVDDERGWLTIYREGVE